MTKTHIKDELGKIIGAYLQLQQNLTTKNNELESNVVSSTGFQPHIGTLSNTTQRLLELAENIDGEPLEIVEITTAEPVIEQTPETPTDLETSVAAEIETKRKNK